MSDYFFKFNKKTNEKINYYKKYHDFLIYRVYLNDNKFNEKKGEIFYIINQQKKYKNPYISSLSFVIEHIDEIDYFEIHL